ncbi:hypothetical protein SAY86_015756 [Trapa natans]|uniref:Uncharacterized protein n=1 Tax=Trapa natans TaxID=22666 RepID=A0AAN7QVT1_TRANT|nr:hypothetical protein SAY86_015756 [Trapa natans]
MEADIRASFGELGVRYGGDGRPDLGEREAGRNGVVGRAKGGRHTNGGRRAPRGVYCYSNSMANKADEPLAVKDTVYRLQNFLLEGISRRLSCSRAVPSCGGATRRFCHLEDNCKPLWLPAMLKFTASDRPHKGRYQISLKEHKVYDLWENYKKSSVKS